MWAHKLGRHDSLQFLLVMEWVCPCFSSMPFLVARIQKLWPDTDGHLVMWWESLPHCKLTMGLLYEANHGFTFSTPRSRNVMKRAKVPTWESFPTLPTWLDGHLYCWPVGGDISWEKESFLFFPSPKRTKTVGHLTISCFPPLVFLPGRKEKEWQLTLSSPLPVGMSLVFCQG